MKKKSPQWTKTKLLRILGEEQHDGEEQAAAHGEEQAAAHNSGEGEAAADGEEHSDINDQVEMQSQASSIPAGQADPDPQMSEGAHEDLVLVQSRPANDEEQNICRLSRTTTISSPQTARTGSGGMQRFSVLGE